MLLNWLHALPTAVFFLYAVLHYYTAFTGWLLHAQVGSWLLSWAVLHTTPAASRELASSFTTAATTPKLALLANCLFHGGPSQPGSMGSRPPPPHSWLLHKLAWKNLLHHCTTQYPLAWLLYAQIGFCFAFCGGSSFPLDAVLQLLHTNLQQRSSSHRQISSKISRRVLLSACSFSHCEWPLEAPLGLLLQMDLQTPSASLGILLLYGSPTTSPTLHANTIEWLLHLKLSRTYGWHHHQRLSAEMVGRLSTHGCILLC